MESLALRFHLSTYLIGFGLCVLTLVLEPTSFAVIAHEKHDGNSTSNGGNNGFVPSPGNETASSVAGANAGMPNGYDYGGGMGGANLCNMDLKSFLPPPYNAISSDFNCKPLWNTFILRYTQSKENLLTIVVSAVYTSGWVGMGFSRDGRMVGSSAMVGWYTKDGKARIRQYYLQGTHPSEVIPDKGELPLTNIPPAVVLYGPSIYMAFQMKFATHVTRQPILLAFGSKYPKHHHHLTHHDAKISLAFDFSKGSTSASSLSSNLEQMRKAHGVLGLIGWGLILPIGAIIARYFKHKDPLWYYLHTIIQFAGFIIILAGVVVGQQLYSKAGLRLPTHKGIGIFALVLSILQVLAFFLRPNKDVKIRKYWNWYHHWFGRLALFFGAVNIVLGIQVAAAGKDWKIGYGFLLAIILIAVIVLEILRQMKLSPHPPEPPFSSHPPEPPTFQMNAPK